MGGGTIFKISTGGTGFMVLHAFATTNGVGGINVGGARPKSGLTLVGSVLFGTTSRGGSGGGGTVFRVNMDGTGFTTLYNFSATNGVGPNGGGTNIDGAYPIGGLLFDRGTLYGTASQGGTSGYGTIFSISTAPVLSIALAGTNAIVTWPSNAIGYNLQSTTNLNSSWDPVAGQYSVTNPVSAKQRFYRLMHP